MWLDGDALLHVDFDTFPCGIIGISSKLIDGFTVGNGKPGFNDSDVAGNLGSIKTWEYMKIKALKP